MDRNETFAASAIGGLDVRLASATLNILAENVADIQLMVSGNEYDVSELRISSTGDMLSIEQPGHGLSMRQLNAPRWMQLTLRVPQGWTGPVNVSTMTGRLSLRGLSGSELMLESVSGEIEASQAAFDTSTVRSVSGDLRLEQLSGSKCSLRTVSGDVLGQQLAFDAYRLNSVSGSFTLDMTRPFQRVDGNSVSGDMTIHAPMTQVNAIFRTVSGRIHTDGVSILEDEPLVHINTVSGDLTMNNNG